MLVFVNNCETESRAVIEYERFRTETRREVERGKEDAALEWSVKLPTGLFDNAR